MLQLIKKNIVNSRLDLRTSGVRCIKILCRIKTKLFMFIQKQKYGYVLLYNCFINLNHCEIVRRCIRFLLPQLALTGVMYVYHITLKE